MKALASDNYASVHPAVMDALLSANHEHASAYGNDPYTQRAEELFKQHFGKVAETYFVFNGTGANVLALNSLCERFSAVLACQDAHINTDECGALEANVGIKIHPVPSTHGKISTASLERFLVHKGNEHRTQPAAISISQATELGTVYSLAELREICTFAKQSGLFVHVDGARLANAAVALQCSFGEMITDSGVDVVSFGGTKNGLMFGEALVFPKGGELAKKIKFLRKQSMQLASKMRYISVQFCTYLENNLWHTNATQANSLAKYLYNKLSKIKQLEFISAPDANSLFLRMPKEWISPLQATSFFYVWDNATSVVRIMTSFDTELQEIDGFCEVVNTLARNRCD